MAFGRFVRARVVAGVLASLLCGIAATAAAQAPDDPRRPRVPAPPPSDFMIGQPRAYLAFDTGFLFANTGSDLYDFISKELTVDKKAFNTPILGGRFGVSITPRLDVVVGFDVAKSQAGSEYRDFVDSQLLPITQSTSREEVNLYGTLRVSLLPSGRRISRFAWVPRRITPYVGVGGGAMKYTFGQFGSFVDAETRRIFTDRFSSTGWAPSAHGLAGADVRVWRRLYLTMEGRYTWSSAPLSDDFVDFEPLALAGARLGGGVRIVF